MSEQELVRVESTEIVPAPMELVITAADLAVVEAAVDLVRRSTQLALSVTNRNDWEKLGGKMYLKKSGTQKVATLFGVSFSEPVTEAVTSFIDGQEVITYTATVTAKYKGREVGEKGVSNTNDKFFSMKGGMRLPLSEIDLPSVEMKAVTKAYNRATKAILGIDGIDPRQLDGPVHEVKYEKPKPAPRPAPQRYEERGAPAHLQSKPIEGGVRMTEGPPQQAPPHPFKPEPSDVEGTAAVREILNPAAAPPPDWVQEEFPSARAPDPEPSADDAVAEIWSACQELAGGNEQGAYAWLETATEFEKDGQMVGATRDLNRIRSGHAFRRKKVLERVREFLADDRKAKGGGA